MPQLYSKTRVGRNQPCPCKSGLKFKHCHGDPGKRAVCERVMAETMVRLIIQEKVKKGMICVHGTPKNDHCKDCAIDD
jgi:hypothetical protein